MNKIIKARILWFLVFLSVFLIVWIILNYLFKDLENLYIGIISAGLSAVFASHKCVKYDQKNKAN